MWALLVGDGEGLRRVQGDGGLRGDGHGLLLLAGPVDVAQEQGDARRERH